MFRRVLVAWDGSADSIAALRMAAEVAGPGQGHVVAFSVLAGSAHREDQADAADDRAARRVSETFEAAKASIAATSPVRIDLHTAQGRHVAGSVCQYATEHGFDLLVIGRHGDGGIAHPRLGHIAEAAARSCKVPLLLVSAG
jgi:nucleotide-binding universal stress UspA family protein